MNTNQISEKALTKVKTSQRDTPRIISKQFKRMQDAERFQQSLYSKYNRVMLTAFPRFSQEGNYVWEVRAASHLSISATNTATT